ncbi:MAG: Rrf2 family transcriptional regulator [Comamonas sp.]|jgi:Rrf2 family nitric oxide-sensitive transcriptional repressor|nr:Rrf2 family transcriptional regulator [Comamonas sp.]
MRLTTLTDYALRVLIYAGSHSERLCTISEIAKAFDISQAHLMKVSQQLSQKGWITTIRGKNGGLHLSQAPDGINLGAVVRSMEPDFALVECLGQNNACKLTGGCALTCIMNGALRAFWQHLDCYTLADVIRTKTGMPGIEGRFFGA